MNKLEELYENVDSIEDLPAFPGIAFDVFRIVRNPNASVRQMEDVIKKDPIIVSQVLKIANSPFYGLKSKVSNLGYAINLLGFVQISNVVMFYVVLGTIKKMPTHKMFDKAKFLDHSFGCGVTAKIVSNMLNLNFGGVEFTGGVIHDIGKILIDIYEPKILDDILEKSHNEQISFYDAEMSLFGITHCEIGFKLLKMWDLPDVLVDVVLNHHIIKRSSNNEILCAVVHVADLLTYSEGIGFGGNYAKFILEDDEAWQLLLKSTDNKKIDVELFTFQLYDNIKKAKILYF